MAQSIIQRVFGAYSLRRRGYRYEMMKKTVDQPFRSKAEREMERALTSRYREIGNPELAAEIRREKQLQGEQPQDHQPENRQQG